MYNYSTHSLVATCGQYAIRLHVRTIYIAQLLPNYKTGIVPLYFSPVLFCTTKCCLNDLFVVRPYNSFSLRHCYLTYEFNVLTICSILPIPHTIRLLFTYCNPYNTLVQFFCTGLLLVFPYSQTFGTSWTDYLVSGYSIETCVNS